MNGGVSKAQTRQSRLKPSKASEGKLVGAVARKRAGKHAGNALVCGKWKDVLPRAQDVRRALENSLQ
ncbi:hypothetical protein GGS23DRAFT_583617 [Durotheca rogersii]|uniref:uncharacterized protein n=1 Tax=Durotheca rogersii TaxID=419775 RepID=UPI0022212894|nr:uncharacterized protein GGS23DRAFT_583617 [Durotheca rogersii]KAI5859785.1 hypothetical protein GGS23DRAFT_583617 [Durotheca rogersii]